MNTPFKRDADLTEQLLKSVELSNQAYRNGYDTGYIAGLQAARAMVEKAFAEWNKQAEQS